MEETHYYPFGLTMAGISSKALKNPYAKNNFNYNGIEQNDEFGLNQYEAYYRTLDPQIGRWNQIDPVSSKYPGFSPYNSNFNNPITFNDPFGDDPPIWGFFNGVWGWGYATKEVFAPSSMSINWGQELRLGLKTFATNGFNQIGNYVIRQQQHDGQRYDLESIPTRATPPVECQEDQQFELINGFPKRKAIDYRTTPEAFKQTIVAYNKSFIFVTDYFAPLVTTLTVAGLDGMLTNVVTRSVVANTAEKAAKGGKELFKFGGSAGRHIAEPGRAVPVQILEQAIKGSKGVADPKGSRALMHSVEMFRNGKPYKLDVLYDKATNTIWHFQYSPIKP